MATSTFYADKVTGAVMISKISSNPSYSQILNNPNAYLDKIKFHSGLNFLTLKGSLYRSYSTFGSFTRDVYSVSAGGDCFNSSTTYTTIAPTTRIQKVSFGASPVANPTLCLMEYNGLIYADFYDGLSNSNVQRRVYPSYNSSTGNLELVAETTAVGADATSQTLSGVTIHAVV